ncbi:MAG TPA: hypothetical protein VK590_13870, partial [Saprospiraceae bacterium]|nr:hypothetical protein [Saprospiraceae bacterium]
MADMHTRFERNDQFVNRHVGPNENELNEMLQLIGVSSLDELIENTIPSNIRRHDKMDIPAALSEFDYLNELKNIASKNK